MTSDIKILTDRTDLWALGLHLTELHKRVELFGPEQVSALVVQLAAQMKAEIPADLLSSMHVVAIPRGGLFVMGELSYALGWRREQFVDNGQSAVCIVDDCALTGKRFAETVWRFKGREIWFCTLASAVELRNAILKDKNLNVKGCLAAVDLALLGETGLPDGDPDRYLNGSVEHVAFPWTEPSLPVTVPMSGGIQDGWHLLPPHKTLGNLALLELPLDKDRLKAEIEVPSGLVWRLDGELVILFEPEGKQVYELSGLGAKVWKMCAGYQNRSTVLKHLKGENAKEVEELIDQCLANRLLVQI